MHGSIIYDEMTGEDWFRADRPDADTTHEPAVTSRYGPADAMARTEERDVPTFVDLSHTIHDGMVTYPGLPPAELGTVLSREESRGRYAPGVEFHIGTATLCTNTGTYLDTPAHRYEDGWDLTGLPLERCVDLPAVVVDIPAGAPERPFGFGASHLHGLELSGAAVLLRTGWSDHWGTDTYGSPDHPYLSAEGTDALVESGAVLVGIDSLNLDSTVGNDRPAHSGLLAAGIPIVEHLTGLSGLPTTGARFTAVPIKVAGLGTFSVRAFATIADRQVVEEIVFDGHDVTAARRVLGRAHGRDRATTVRRVGPGHAVALGRSGAGLPAGTRGEVREEPAAPRHLVGRHRG